MVKDSKTSAVQQESYEECCHRCGGFMVPEPVFELGSVNWRCIGCGERIDPVILAHRQVYRPEESASEDAKKLSADHGKRRLN